MTAGWTRRTFLELGAAGIVAAVAGSAGPTSSFAAPPADRGNGKSNGHGKGNGHGNNGHGNNGHGKKGRGNPRDEEFVEMDVTELQRLMAEGQLSSHELTKGYLRRIRELNPILNAVIETNPEALKIANRMDRERRFGHVRGPLHGIPVIVKDNIATDDKMETTAGSLALVGSRVPEDAPLVRQLRDAGAVILGKANLSEWANFRGFGSINGWSARGGFTRNPYVLELDPCGSSSGSAAAAAASLCAVAVGTETDGSILCPAGEQSLVGIKPTVGLVSGSGIIPIAHSQDTAGPMTRTVRDSALLLDAIRVPGATVLGQSVPATYTAFLDAGALQGARLAYDTRYVEGDFGPGVPGSLELIEIVLDKLSAEGAEVVEVESVDPRDEDVTGRIPFDDELTVLLFEFKVQIAEYLATLRRTDMRTLADLIAFNVEHCDEELRYFGQEIFELAEATSGDLNDPEYLAAKATNQAFGKVVIDGILSQGFDAVITPTFSFGTSPAAVSGDPSMAVPVGYTDAGHPVGLWLAAGFMQEPKLIGLGYAIEQLLQARVAPTLSGPIPPEPPRFDGCPTDGQRRSASTAVHRHGGTAMHPRHW